MALPPLSCQLRLLCRNICLSWRMGMDHPCCSLPAQAFFGHWPWEQTGTTLASHSWLLERPYKYLAVGWIHSYMESGKRKRRRRNNSTMKHSACGRVKRGEQPQRGAQHRMKAQLQDSCVLQWIISHVHQATVLLPGLFKWSSVI